MKRERSNALEKSNVKLTRIKTENNNTVENFTLDKSSSSKCKKRNRGLSNVNIKIKEWYVIPELTMVVNTGNNSGTKNFFKASDICNVKLTME